MPKKRPNSAVSSAPSTRRTNNRRKRSKFQKDPNERVFHVNQPNESESESGPTHEDEDFFREYGQYSGFLDSLNANELRPIIKPRLSKNKRDKKAEKETLAETDKSSHSSSASSASSSLSLENGSVDASVSSDLDSNSSSDSDIVDSSASSSSSLSLSSSSSSLSRSGSVSSSLSDDSSMHIDAESSSDELTDVSGDQLKLHDTAPVHHNFQQHQEEEEEQVEGSSSDDQSLSNVSSSSVSSGANNDNSSGTASDNDDEDDDDNDENETSELSSSSDAVASSSSLSTTTSRDLLLPKKTARSAATAVAAVRPKRQLRKEFVEQVSDDSSGTRDGSDDDADYDDDDDDSDDEAYERRPRRERRVVERLPVRDQYGRMVKPPSNAMEEKTDDQTNKKRDDKKTAKRHATSNVDTVNDDDNEDDRTASQSTRHQAHDLLRPPAGVVLTRPERVALARERIASMCDAIVQMPEENVERLSDLLTLSRDTDTAVARLALLSLLAVFRQVLPAYRIREDYSAEANQKISKPVLELRRFELALLGSYKEYVRRLSRALAARRTVPQTKLACARCLGGLLAARPDFNYRDDVVAALVAAAEVRDDATAREACVQMHAVFGADPDGAVTLVLVRGIGRLIKARDHNVRTQLLEALRSVQLRLTGTNPLDRELDVRDGLRRTAAQLRAGRKHETKAEARRRKAERAVERDMRDFRSQGAMVAHQRTNTEILHALFTIYFRVLKKASHTPLLPLALDSVARHAHLLNVEMMNDLLKVLEQLLLNSDGIIAFPIQIKCILAAFRALRNQGYVVDIDVKCFTTHLYALLLTTPSALLSNTIDSNDYCAEVLFACYLALCDQPQPEQERAAAFVKRLASLTTALPPHQATACLVIVQQILQRYPRSTVLLDNDAGGGMFRPDIDNPEHCGALSSTLWETSLLAAHWHPALAQAAVALANGKTTPFEGDVTLRSLRELIHSLDTTSRATFTPPVRTPTSRVQKRSKTAHADLVRSDAFNTRLRQRRAVRVRPIAHALAPPVPESADAARHYARTASSDAAFARLMLQQRANDRIRRAIAVQQQMLYSLASRAKQKK